MKTTLKILVITLSASCFLTQCQNKPNDGDKGNTESITGRSANLEKLSRSLLGSVVAGAPKNNLNEESPSAIPKTRNDLGEMRAAIKMFDGTANAGITVPGFGSLKLGKDEKSLSVYYIETKAVINGRDTSVYGIGYSVHYLFKKIKKGLSIDKLPFLAASVQLDGSKTQVFYSIQSHGIIGRPLVKFFKPQIDKPFDVDGFGIMQSSIDGIQNILGDSTLSQSLKFTPVLFPNIKANELN